MTSLNVVTDERPKLLNLPRELRDNIYEHLYHSFNFRWTAPFSRNIPLKVIVEHAPLIDVICTHPRIQEEYLSSANLKNLHVTIIIELTLKIGRVLRCIGPPFMDEKKAEVVVTRSAASVFKHVRHFTVVIRTPVGRVWATTQRIVWSMAKATIVNLTQLAPKLSTIKIAMQYHTQFTNSFLADDILSTPPTELTGLSLCQNAVGYHPYEFADPRYDTFPEVPNAKLYIAKCGAYVYAKEVKKSWLWNKDQLIEALRMGDTSNSMLTRANSGIWERMEWREMEAHPEGDNANKLGHGKALDRVEALISTRPNEEGLVAHFTNLNVV